MADLRSFTIELTPDLADRLRRKVASREHLRNIQGSIADRTSPPIALRYVEAITAHCEQLTNPPYRGTRRDDIRPGFRSIGFRNRATIIFSVERAGIVLIAGICYRGRDIAPDRDDAADR